MTLARVESPDPAGRWLAKQALEALEQQARAYDREGLRRLGKRCRDIAVRLAAADPVADYATWLDVKNELETWRHSWKIDGRGDVVDLLTDIINDADRRARARESDRLKAKARSETAAP